MTEDFALQLNFKLPFPFPFGEDDKCLTHPKIHKINIFECWHKKPELDRNRST